MESERDTKRLGDWKEPETGEDVCPQVSGFAAVIGKSAAIQREVEKARRFARSDSPVLITGETGTGKEIIARAIHYAGPRANAPFVPVNCVALPGELVENELFGHRPGAYTGAGRVYPGLIAQAESGTLFLDEIESLAPAAQGKLLRFLQEGEYRPLGSNQTARAHVRIVAASNADLGALAGSGDFRRDLYYRLDVLALNLPPLRERREDIPLLAEHLLEGCGKQPGGGPVSFSHAAMRRLLEHDWPGNIRELRNVIQRVLVICDESVIEAEHLGLPAARRAEAGLSFAELKARVIDEFERGYLTASLACFGGNITQAAKAAKKDRSSFIRLLRRHGIPARSRASAPHPETLCLTG